jgi:hypothetical protein
MARDAEPALTSNVAEDRLGGLIGADVLLDVERDNVRVLATAQTILRHLRARDDQHPILLQRAITFLPDVCKIALEVLFAKSKAPLSERRQPGRPGKQVFLHQDVIGDGDDVEFPRSAIEIHDFSD